MGGGVERKFKGCVAKKICVNKFSTFSKNNKLLLCLLDGNGPLMGDMNFTHVFFFILNFVCVFAFKTLH